jgi:class 3 adenylate cyclase/tetratricopeptide (TPR) repeat protein
MQCPRCQLEAPAGARFCPACGTRIAASTEAERFGSPDSYTPPYLAEKILTARPALEGERKQITVLFADTRGSMELLADRDPEEGEKVLGQVLECMLEAVHRYEGTVNQVMGDGIMALFGAPVAHEDHAVRACFAALRMQERVAALREPMLRAHGFSIQIRIGVNAGEVVVRSIGSDLHMAYTALGSTVHLAARMEQMAQPGTVLATADTVKLAGPHVLARPVGPVPVKGLEAPVEVYEIVGPGPVRSRAEAAAARGMTRFVGRDAELAELEAALRAARAGQGQIVALVGEAGVGKSRLLHEFLGTCRSAGCLVVETAALSYGRAVAHRPGIELVRRYFGIEAGDDPRTIHERVTTRLLELDPALEDAGPPLLWMLGALPAGSPFLARHPEARRRRAMHAVRRLVARQSQVQPFVLVFEDLQWVDSETQTWIDSLVSAIPPATLLLVSHRAGDQDRWAGTPGYRRLQVAPIPPAAATELLDDLLGGDPGLASLKQVLISRTEGTPLFLEECVRQLAGTGVLAGRPGAYRLARSVTTVEVPPSVRAVLAARIDSLPPGQKRILQSAAVIGEDVPAALVEAISEVPADEVRRSLSALRTAGLLDERALFPDLELSFTHALAHDVAYEGLLQDRRRALHARIVDAMERLLPSGRLADQVGRLAHHAFRGERWDRAVGYLREAAARAMARFASREAGAFLEQALVAVRRLPQTAATRALTVDLHCELAGALMPLGEHARLLERLGEAETLAAALGEELRLARVLAFLSNTLWELGDSDRAMETGQRALDIASRSGDRDLQVALGVTMGGAHRALGDYRRAVTFLRQSLEVGGDEVAGEAFGLPGPAAVLARGHLAWSLGELGDFVPAFRAAEEAVRIARRTSHAYSLAHADLGLGGMLLRQGRFGEARVVLERGLVHCEDAPALAPPVMGDLGLIQALTGDTARGLETLQDAVERAERMARRGRLSLILTHLAEGYILAGRPDEALAPGLRALDLARRQKERGNEVYALRLLGFVAAEREPPRLETAVDLFGAALAMAGELGMRPLIARCHLGLGRLARRLGDAAGATAHLDTATRLFRELGMDYWLGRLGVDRVGPPSGPPAGPP